MGDLRCMGTPPSFTAMFSKGDNFRDFLLAYLENIVFLKWGPFLKERICSDGSKCFPLWLIREQNDENDRVASSVGIPIHIKLM